MGGHILMLKYIWMAEIGQVRIITINVKLYQVTGYVMDCMQPTLSQTYISTYDVQNNEYTHI